MPANAISIRAEGLDDVRKEFERMKKQLERKEINKIQRRHARPMLQDMKNDAPSTRIASMTAITTRQTKQPRAPYIGIRIGVINNDASEFPDFSAPALASVLEHGTKERFRRAAKSFGISIGTQSTGSVKGAPWLSPAWDRNVESFVRKCIDSMEKQI